MQAGRRGRRPRTGGPPYWGGHLVFRVAFEEVPDVVHRHAEAGFQGFGRDSGAVRGQHDVAQEGERVVLGQGFGGEDVEAGAGDAAVGERVPERCLMDDGAAGGVDQDGGGLHQGELRGADEVRGLRGETEMQAHDVAGAIEFVELDELDAGVALRVHRPDDDAHADCRREAGEVAADGAVADHAAGLAVEFDGASAGPAAEAGGGVHFRECGAPRRTGGQARVRRWSAR